MSDPGGTSATEENILYSSGISLYKGFPRIRDSPEHLRTHLSIHLFCPNHVSMAAENYSAHCLSDRCHYRGLPSGVLHVGFSQQ